MKLLDKRIFTVFVVMLSLTIQTTIFDASEIDASSEVGTSEEVAVKYAPVNPTREEVETAADTDIVVFEDPVFEQNIAESITHYTGETVSVGEITVGDMKKLPEISSNKEGITDITGIEYAVNIKSAIFEYENIPDLTPLSNLTSLEVVMLNDIGVTDIEPLSNLINLKYLDISDNEISDFSPISNLTNLRDFSAERTGLSDMSVIADLPNLEYLDLAVNDLEVIPDLSGLESLKQADFHANNISDISGFATASDTLTIIELNSNAITDIEPLTKLDKLEKLNLTQNKISTLPADMGLESIISLNLEFNNIEDITPLSSLTTLNTLNLGRNNIEDITPLSSLTTLNTLNLERNNIEDITPLSSLTTLNTLNLESNKIHDISPLSSLTMAEDVRLEDQSVDVGNIYVDTLDEVFYDVIDINGNVQPFSLGVPNESGTEQIISDWELTQTIGNDTDVQFSGGFSGTIYYDATSTLTGNESASTTEENPLSDQALINLFEVENSADQTITVDQSAVDYTTPGEYQVTFTDESNHQIIGTLSVTDVLPTLVIDNTSITLPVASTIDDVLSNLSISASEINSGDLNGSVVYDDSNVDYNTPGVYTIAFSVTDAEGNVVNQDVQITITNDATAIVDPEDPTSETTDSTTTDESVTSENKQMNLATTGSNVVGLILTLVVILIVALGIKQVIKHNSK